MAEMLVRLYDKYTGKDPVIQSKTTHRGDVIVVQEDGWAWSQLEKSSPDWIILKVDMPIEKARTMLAPEQGNPLINPLLQLRAFKLDLDNLTSLGYLIPDSKTAMQLRFFITPKGISENTKDPITSDPIFEILEDIKIGNREQSYITLRPIDILLVLENHFDIAKTLKTKIEDRGVIV